MNASRFPIQCITKEPSNGKRGSVFAFLQETNGVVQKDHDVFLNDLEYDGVDPLGASALQNAQSESGIVAEDKWYSYEKKKLSSSSPLRIVDYFDPSFDYVNENKKYRELLTEVNKELEYKSEKKGDAGKKKGRWGSPAQRRGHAGSVPGQDRRAAAPGGARAGRHGARQCGREEGGSSDRARRERGPHGRGARGRVERRRAAETVRGAAGRAPGGPVRGGRWKGA